VGGSLHYNSLRTNTNEAVLSLGLITVFADSMHVSDPHSLFAFPWQGTGLTDPGLIRTSNQDSFALENQLGLWIIADGMGGHAGGNLASQLAVQSTVIHVRQFHRFLQTGGDLPTVAKKLLVEAVATSHAAIQQQVVAQPEFEGMGTTIVIALYCPGPQPQLALAHVGDSRAYLIRNGTMRLLTSDHSLVQRLVDEGQITPDQALNHPQQNILLRAVGADRQSTPDVQLQMLEPEDIILLCTDGLTKTVSEDDILAIVRKSEISPSEACRQLIERANSQGGKDNTTVILISPSE
jgi:protein phosphatase